MSCLRDHAYSTRRRTGQMRRVSGGRITLRLLGMGIAMIAACACSASAELAPPPPVRPTVQIHKIRHVVIIMQENRSFDSYFGTYPGADGLPMSHGVPSDCVPDPSGQSCIR